MKKAVYPGSFDPITCGHIDIIKRIADVFTEVVVVISSSPDKNYLFSTEERKKLVIESLKGMPNVKVDTHDGLTVNYVKTHGMSVIVRGLRAVTDFEYEMTMCSLNKKLAPEVETMLVFARPEYYYISSRGVKEVVAYGGAADGLVPPHVIEPLKLKLQRIKE